MPSPSIEIGIRATNAGAGERKPAGGREQLAVGPQHGRHGTGPARHAAASACEDAPVTLPDADARTTPCCWSPSAGPEEPGRRAAVPAERHRAAAASRPSGCSEVGEHYLALRRASARSTAQNRALLAALEDDFAAHGLDLPVYWGNRNWDPVPDRRAGRDARRRRSRRVLALLHSAYSSYSGCRQYRENLAAAVAPLGEGAPRIDRVRHYFNHPGFVETMVRRT